MKNKWISSKVEKLKPSAIRKVSDKVNALQSKGIKIANFSIGRPFFDTPNEIKEETKRALDQGMVHYTRSAGTRELREAIAQRIFLDRSLKVNPEEIIVTIGASEAMFIATQALLSPGDEVIVPEPMYVYYRGWINLAGAKCVEIPLKGEDNFVLSPQKIKEKINSHTKMIILNSPHNPTGQVFSREILEEVAQLTLKYNLIVASDEIYHRITYEGSKHYSIAAFPEMRERTILIDSFSKSYAMDGWRIGYLVAPLKISRQMLKLHQHTVSCPNTFVQRSALIALNSDQECVESMVKEFTRRRKLVINYLKRIKLPFVKPKGAFYVFPSIKELKLDCEKFVDYLLEEAKVAVVPGNAFGKTGEEYIRISFSLPYEEIATGMERMEKAVQKLRECSGIS